MPATRRSILVSLLAQDQEFQRLQADDARAAAARAGLDAEVLFADNTAVLQIQQLYRAIHRPSDARPAAIVVETVVGEGLERVAHAAVEAGIGWILVNRRVAYLEDLRRRHPELPISLVGTDQEVSEVLQFVLRKGGEPVAHLVQLGGDLRGRVEYPTGGMAP